MLRDAQGDWLLGYHQGVGFSLTLQAKLWAVVDGLRCLELGFSSACR